MKLRKTGISRRGLLGASAGLAAGAGLGLPRAVLAGATTTTEAALPASVAAAEAAVAQHQDAILRISREVWALAELSVAEVKSAEVHLHALAAAGFKTASTGTSGFPAAFVSEGTQGSGGPIVGFLPEYDALPDLGNVTEPVQKMTPNGLTNGHGCGHNALGAGCTGAAFALKTMMEAAGTPGTIRIYGCSAEETEGVKVHMARDGLFDDLDAALAWHPAPHRGHRRGDDSRHRLGSGALPWPHRPCRQHALGWQVRAEGGRAVRRGHPVHARACADYDAPALHL